MKRFILFKNGAVVGHFISERAARFRFLKVCQSSDFNKDDVCLLDLEDDAKTIAMY